jgi:PAS domain S-box-containing protein
MEAFRSGKITVPELYYSKFQKKIQWEVFAPINENNKIIATVLFLIDPSDFFFPMIRDWPASTKTEEALLVRRDGQQFICITPLKKADNSKLQLSFPLDQKENILGSELYEGPDYSGDMVVANISKIPRSSWFLIVKEDSSEVYADFHKLFTLIVILIILFILFAIVLVSMVYHRKQKNLYKKLLHQSNTLHHTQEELGATLYSIGDGVITTNAEGYINHMNPAAESLTGWSELEAKGKWIGEIFQIVDENTGKKIENPLFHLLNEREKNPAVVYLTLLSRGKKEIYIRNSGALIKDKQGERLGTILFFSDQSESKLRQKLIELRLNFFLFH